MWPEERIPIKSDKVFCPKLFRDYVVPDLLAFLQASFFLVFNFTQIGSLKIVPRIRIGNAPTCTVHFQENPLHRDFVRI